MTGDEALELARDWRATDEPPAPLIVDLVAEIDRLRAIEAAARQLLERAADPYAELYVLVRDGWVDLDDLRQAVGVDGANPSSVDGVSPSSGEPYGPGTVVDTIADEINETVGMSVSWPRISGIAHRAAARLRREGHLMPLVASDDLTPVTTEEST